MSKTNHTISILVLTAFLTDFFTPYFIWQGQIPDAIRWFSQGAILLMTVLVFFRMIAFGRIPAGFLVIAAMSLIGLLVGYNYGQSITVCLWGWWLMYQFPLISLYCSMQISWPRNYGRLLTKVCIGLLALEVIFQFIQFFQGVPPGDDLSGFFGDHGTSSLVLFIIFTLCLTIGEWLHSSNWLYLVIAFGLGTLSSVLGEMKFFLLAAALAALVAMVIFVLRGRQIWRIIPYSLAILFVLIVFVFAYDAVIPGAQQMPLESFLTNPSKLLAYLDISNPLVAGENYYYDIGRNFAIIYGWEQIQTDPETLLFGYGLGARSESRSLGIIGRALTEGSIGVTSGTSLLVIMQETGVIGLLIWLFFILVTISKTMRLINSQPDSTDNGMRFGMIIFTLFWPIWLWYAATLAMRLPMTLYWSTLGYIFSRPSMEKEIEVEPADIDLLNAEEAS